MEVRENIEKNLMSHKIVNDEEFIAANKAGHLNVNK